ncbi:2-deoxyribose-5-phosphate aldolase, partial [bacterium]|nr:2-deoxyribose-5-phosphate aldolase [bacterium]
VVHAVSRVRDALPAQVLKVILETSELSEVQLTRAAEIALDQGADFLKTSTGFASGGATVEHVQLLAKLAGKRAQVKASGGIRTYKDMLRMLQAGATRIGASTGAAILADAEEQLGAANA